MENIRKGELMKPKQYISYIKTYFKVQNGNLNTITIPRSYQNLHMIQKNMSSDERAD